MNHVEGLYNWLASPQAYISLKNQVSAKRNHAFEPKQTILAERSRGSL